MPKFPLLGGGYGRRGPFFIAKRRKRPQTDAATRARLSVASENFSFSRNRDAIKRREKRTEITQDNILQEVARLGFGNMRSFVAWGPDGITLKGSTELSETDAVCVAEVNETRTKDGGSTRFKLHDKTKALELLGRHLGIFTEKHEVTGKDSGPVEVYARVHNLSDSELERLIEAAHAASQPAGGGRDERPDA